MTMISKGTLGICAGVAGAIIVGYCVYFDQKRRSDPDFKKKLREKRRKATKSTASSVKWPNIKDPDEVKKFFLSQVETGEVLLASGDIEGGVEHLSRAITICPEHNQLLQVMQQTLPPQVFRLLLQKLPSTGESMMAAVGGTKVQDEDVE